jgi:hypothetical protein
MNRYVLLCGWLVLAAACGREGIFALPTVPSRAASPTPPTAPPPPLAPPDQVRQITVGTEVEGLLTAHGGSTFFALTAPLDGMLVARVSWDRSRGVLEMNLAGTRFGPIPGDRSFIVGELSVVAGQRYQIVVADGAPWDYDNLYLPFVLATAMK